MSTKIFKISIFLLSLLLPMHSHVAAEIPDADELYQGVGIDPERMLYGNDPTEYIDPFSGQLLLNNVDLRLPGNGGLDLVIQRNYLSQDHEWRIIFGRIKYKSGLVTLEMADGSVHYGYAVPNTNNTEFLTKEFWKIHYPVGANETNPPYATLTDGTVITFAYKPVGNFYATSIEKNNNKISIHYTKIAADVAFPIYFDVLDYVEDSIGRKVYFTHDFLGDSVKLVKISYCPDYSNTCSEADRRAIQYKYKDYEYSSHRLEEVKPPQGPSWHYDYSPEDSYRLVTAISPVGGVTKYTWGQWKKWIDSLTYKVFFGVTGKTTSGRGVPALTRTFSYAEANSADDFDYTTISDSTGRTTRYKYYGYNKTYVTSKEECWQVGLTRQIEQKDSNGVLESRVDIEYEKSLKEFSDVPHRIAGLCSDSRTYIPREKSRTITRDGRTYTTSYETFDLFENPTLIYEHGDVGKETAITYWYNTGLNIVKNTPATITVNSENFPGTLATTNTYNNLGLLTEMNSNGVISASNYFANGNTEWTRDANGNTISYQWSNGRISKISNEQYPASPTTRQINPDGTIKSVTSGRGNTTFFTYDLLGRLTSIVPPSSTEAPSSQTTISYPVTSFTYGANEYQVNTGKITRRLSTFIKENIDGLGRPVGTEDDLGITTETAYKINGLKDYSGSSVGDTSYYDNLGRVHTVVHKDDTASSYQYSGSDVIITDESGTTSRQYYAAFGDPDQKILTAIDDMAGKHTDYTYNIAGNLTSVNFDGAAVGTYGYDSHFFLSSENHPETGTITFTRDALGNIKSITDALGTRTYVYDKLNRLANISYGSDSTIFAYDQDNNIISLSNPFQSSIFTYDAVNRLAKDSSTIGNMNYLTSYKYDAGDNIREIIYPSGRDITYVYNTHNQLISIPGFTSNIKYISGQPAAGLVKSVDYNNGISQQYSYSARNRITSINAGNNATDDNVLARVYSYADPRGNLTAIENTTTAKTKSFTYDALNRLKNFNGPWGNGTYSYSANGNRTAKSINGLVENYGYANNRLISVGGGATGFSYNTSGDVAQINRDGKSHVLGYDMLHNLASYSLAGGDLLATFSYDANGRRIVKRNEKSGFAVIYHYDQEGNIISEDNGNGTLIADYIYLHGKLLAKVANPAGQPSSDFDGDGLDIDTEGNIGTDPYSADSDGDGLNDGEELEYWGDNWNGDADADGLINILDNDSDNDGYLDGEEMSDDTNPGDPASLPTPVIHIIPQTGWLLHYVDSEELVGEDGAAINAFDGDPASIWHTEWKLKKTPPPHEIQIDLGAVYDLGGFRYLPRQDNGTNGIISQYALYVSVDGLNWGTPVSEDTFVSGSAEKEVLFPTTTGRFVRFVGLRDINNSLFTSVAELNFLGGLYTGNIAPQGTIDTPAGNVVISLGQSIVFSGTGSDSDNNEPLTYLWNFGDPAIADAVVKDPGLVEFNNTGTYTVTFTVTDDLGAIDASPASFVVTVVDGAANPLIPQTGWLLHYVDSEELVGEDGAAINAFDGDPASIWHTEWKLKKTPPPHEIQIDLGTVYDLGGFRYLPRQDNGTNGIISQYALYVSVDGLNWGTPVSEGTFVSGSAEKEVLFPTTTGRFVSFVGLRDINNSLFTSVAELNFLGGLHEGN